MPRLVCRVGGKVRCVVSPALTVEGRRRPLLDVTLTNLEVRSALPRPPTLRAASCPPGGHLKGGLLPDDR